MVKRHIPKQCPKCGSDEIHTEVAYQRTRYYKKGKFKKEMGVPLSRLCFCDKCSHEFETINPVFDKKKAQ